jgi:hypothetical protein
MYIYTHYTPMWCDMSPLGAGVAYVVPTGVGSCRQLHAFLQKPQAAAAAAEIGAITSQQQQQQRQQQPSQVAKEAAAKSSGGGPIKSLGAWAAGVQVWLNGNKPAWMHHMFSHVLIDADLAIQSRVDYNR